MARKKIKLESDNKAILTDGTILYDTDLYRKYNEAVYAALTGQDVSKDNSIYPFVHKSIKGMFNPERKDLGINSISKLKDLVIDTNSYFQQDQQDMRDFVEYKIFKTLFPWQQNVLNNLSPKVTLLCGRRSGKSYLESGLAVLHCTAGYDISNGIKKPRSVLVMGLTIAKTQDVFWENIKKYVELSKLRTARIDNSKLRITFENGAVIQLAGNSSKSEREKLRGGEWSLMIIDEAQSQPSLNYLMIDILGPIAKGRSSTFILSGTGAITNKGYWKDITTGDLSTHWTHFTATMKDNPSIPADALETVLKDNNWDKDNVTFRREYLAENIIDTTRIVYPEYHKPDNIPIIEYIAIGVDYGWSDSNALVAIGKSKNKYYELQSKKFNKADVTTLVTEIKSMWDSLQSQYKVDKSCMICIADTNDQTISAEVYRHHVKIANAYKVDRIQQIFDLREALRRGDIMVNSDVLIDEMESYVWKYDEDSKSVIYETDDEYFHPDCLAALRYAYYYLTHRSSK